MKSTLWILLLLFPAALGGLVLVGGGDGEYEGHTSIQIRRRVPHVYAWIALPEHRVQWMEGLNQSSQAKGIMPRAGARFEETCQGAEGPERRVVEVTDMVEEKSFSYRTTRNGQPFEITFSVESPYSVERTVVTVDYRTSWSETWQEIGEPILSSRLRAEIQEDLERLKAMSESAPEAF